MTAVRDQRLARGLTQAELASLAGVSRQLVGAVESGRHVPSVEAALDLARALGLSVEALFGKEPTLPVSCEPVIAGAPAVTEGSGVLLGRVGTRDVWGHEETGPQETWPVPDGTWRNGHPAPYADVEMAALVLAGCDPALGVAARLLERRGVRVMRQHAPTAAALEALEGGRIHAAVVHGPAGQLPTTPIGVHRWRLGAWQVGVAYSSRRPGWAQLASGRVRVARRDPGAASQQSLERLLELEGLPRRLRGPLAGGHLDAAYRVRLGLPAAVTMEPAATFLGLHFTPIELHTVELWIPQVLCPDHRLDSLLDTLASRPFRDRIAAVGGYELADAPEAIVA